VIALALGVWTQRPRFTRLALAAPLALVVATLLTLAPWAIRNAIVFDRWVGLGTSAGYALAGTYNAEARARGDHPGEPYSPNRLQTYRALFGRRDLDEARFIGRLNDRAIDYIRAHPGYVVETMAWNVPRLLELVRRDRFEPTFAALEVQAAGVGRIDSPVLLLGSLYLVILLALLGVGTQVGLLPGPRVPGFVWGVALLLALPALAIYGLPRYRAPLDPFLLLLAALGCAATVDRATRRS
jgi:hypothetical protein